MTEIFDFHTPNDRARLIKLQSADSWYVMSILHIYLLLLSFDVFILCASDGQAEVCVSVFGWTSMTG